MLLRSIGSLRIRLTLLVLLAVLPALVLVLSSDLAQRRRSILNAEEDALRLARNVARMQKQMIDDAHQILFTLSQMSQVQQRDAQFCAIHFANLLEHSKGFTSFTVAKPDGEVFASAPVASQPINYSDRPWYRRILQTLDFTVGEYQVGRFDGEANMVLAQPVLDGSGHLTAILTSSLDLGWLNQLVGRSELPAGATCSLTDHAGTVLARFPDPQRFVGKSIPDAVIFKAMADRGEGVIETAGLDGVRRIFGFTSLGQAPEVIYARVGIPRHIAFAQADRDLFWNLSFLGVVALLALIAAWFGGHAFIVKQVEGLLHVVKKLGDGDLKARMGAPYSRGELGQLAQAFDQMAELLQHRETERHQAVEALRRSEQGFRSLIENGVDMITILDADGGILYESPSIERLLGYKAEELWGKTVFQYVHPEDLEEVREAFRNVLRIPESFVSMEFRFKHKDGTWRLMEGVGKNLLEDSVVAGIVFNFRDISDRRLLENLVCDSHWCQGP